MARRPVKGDPFRDFAGFASSTLNPETRLRLRGGASLDDLRKASKIELDMFAANWRGSLNECAAIINRLGEGREASVAELLALFPPSREPQIQLSLLWLCKLGLVAWDEPI